VEVKAHVSVKFACGEMGVQLARICMEGLALGKGAAICEQQPAFNTSKIK
jgi:hypothetical protein